MEFWLRISLDLYNGTIMKSKSILFSPWLLQSLVIPENLCASIQGA